MAVPADLNTVHTPSTGGVAPAAWGLHLRTWTEFLIDPPTCSVFNSSAQSVANDTATAMTANSENFDNDAMHSTVSNTSRITIVTPGRYLFISTGLFANNTAGSRSCWFRKNGTTDFFTASVPAATGAFGTEITASRSFTLVAGDYLETFVRQTSTAALNVTLGEFFAMFLTR